jgi:hypothetical protein
MRAWNPKHGDVVEALYGGLSSSVFFSKINQKRLDSYSFINYICIVRLREKYLKLRDMAPDWKKMGFNGEKEYNDFLQTQMEKLINKIKNNPKLLDVFKRLNDR